MAEESREPDSKGDGSENGRRMPRQPINTLVMVLILIVLVLMVGTSVMAPKVSVIKSYPFFLEQIRGKNVSYVVIGPHKITGFFREPPPAPSEYDESGKLETPKDRAGKPKKLEKKFEVYYQGDQTRKALEDMLGEKVADEKGELKSKYDVDFSASPPPEDAMPLLWLIMIGLSIATFAFVWSQFRRMRDSMSGGGFLSGFSKSPAKRYEGAKQPITFKDVAGLEGVKADLLEIVEFLKSPDKFRKLGGHIPKGVLLNGPPGTGKTLLARAVAGEAGVPFFSVNGSEFIQMFVGVGASRVRDLFRTAKEASPSIIFIDEIDAVGRQRGAGLGGGHDEREQTLNQILGEMDGFSQTEAVIVIAATNRPDVLDPALLRPGRFDRHVTVGRPTQKGRVEILKVHTRDVPLADDVDLDIVASSTIGLTGADLRNIVNEAALWAARQNKTKVDRSDFDYARDKVLIGAKREEVLQEEEKEKTAYHEAGHTLAAWLSPGAHRVHKVTIIPRGRSLGATHTLPAEDRMSMSASEIRDHLIVMLGGRAAERLIYKEITVGAENDLERATDLARHMVTHWGMSERLGPVSCKTSDEDPFLGREMHRPRPFSERTMEIIDEEVERILRAADEKAEGLLVEHRDKLESLTRALLKDEELDDRQITQLIGPSIQSQKNGKPKEG